MGDRLGHREGEPVGRRQELDWLPGRVHLGRGRGTSKTVPQPYYQKNVVPKALATANNAAGNRVVPDIAAIADPNTGFLVGQTQTFPDGSEKYSEYRIGGTSLAAPVIAAVQALAQEARGGKAIASPTRRSTRSTARRASSTTSRTTRRAPAWRSSAWTSPTA